LGDGVLLFLALELLLFPILWIPFWEYCDFQFVCSFLFLFVVFLAWTICIYYFAANLRILALGRKRQNTLLAVFSAIYYLAMIAALVLCYQFQELTSLIPCFQFFDYLLSHKIETSLEIIAAVLLIYVNRSFLEQSIKQLGEY
jgi:hypothetical protein